MEFLVSPSRPSRRGARATAIAPSSQRPHPAHRRLRSQGVPRGWARWCCGTGVRREPRGRSRWLPRSTGLRHGRAPGCRTDHNGAVGADGCC